MTIPVANIQICFALPCRLLQLSRCRGRHGAGALSFKFVSAPHSAWLLLAFFVEALWFGILTPAFLGFPISDEAGVNHINMYPYIIPTAFVIFFFASRGWRWFGSNSVNRRWILCATFLLMSLLIAPHEAAATVDAAR